MAAIGNGAAFAKGRDFAALSTHAVNAGRSRYFAQASKLGKAQFLARG
jgi:hypothetical protein